MELKKIGIPSLLMLVGQGSFAVDSYAGELKQVEVYPGTKETLIELRGQQLQGFSHEEKKDPPELVLTFKETRVSKSVETQQDVSTFRGNVMQVATYEKSKDARVVIDFRNRASYQIEESPDRITIKVATPNSPGSGAADLAGVKPEILSVKTVASAEENTLETASKVSDKNFTGTPITLKLKDADVAEVLRLISEASGFNIVIHPSVTGRLTLSLERVPWDQALDVVLTTLKLAADRSQSVLRVMPRELFLAEKQAELEAKRIAATAAPRITRIFPISYADPQQLSSLLTSFANSQNAGPGGASIPATIIVDQNTQSLVVRETAENIERIKKMIQLLDVQTPQVLLEGKVIEASSDFAKEISGSLGVGGTSIAANFNRSSQLAGTLPTGGLAGEGGGAFGLAGGVRILERPILLNSLLSITEKDNRAKVVSSPRLVVLSGKTANINQTRGFSFTATQPPAATGATVPLVVNVTANTRLNVTPRVTNEGSVFMKLDLSRDVINTSNTQNPIAEPRTISTEVIVDSGNTLVVGGILNLDQNHVDSGFPILRKIPIFGWMFGNDTNTEVKSEIMFFVTPRVLNPRKNGDSSPEESQAPPMEAM
jgi:type IV pilus assembly protein PilQ